MARTADQTSTRQVALRTLDQMKDTPRAIQLEKLRGLFPNSANEYLKTLWNHWRSECKENGSLIEVFTVRDDKRGVKVEPYLKSEWMFNPPDNACLTPQTAKIRYRTKLKAHIETSYSL